MHLRQFTAVNPPYSLTEWLTLVAKLVKIQNERNTQNSGIQFSHQCKTVGT